jgi:hypothetical protein
MQKVLKSALWCIGIALLVSGVSAFTVTGVAIAPSGTLNPGDGVNVSYTVFAASGVAFPSYDDLQFISGLDETVWSYSIVVNGVENVRPVVGGHTVTITGFELSYRNQDEVLVKASLRGRVPLSFVPGSEKTLATIQELDSRGYVINTTTVTVSHLIGTPTPTPTPASGSIIVTTIPSGADVYIDNSYKGFSPLTIEPVSNGNHDIVLLKDGYEQTLRTINVMGTLLTLNVALTPIPTSIPTATGTRQTTVTSTFQPGQPSPEGGVGSLSVTTSPPGAIVYVDGETKGVTPATIPGLPSGKHSVLLVLAGYSSLNTTITITSGETSEYSTALAAPAKTPGFGMIVAFLSLALLLLVRKIRK